MTTLSPAVLAEARQTLTQIDHAAGIGVQWKTPMQTYSLRRYPWPPRRTTLQLRSRICAERHAKRGRHAFVLADRIRTD